MIKWASFTALALSWLLWLVARFAGQEALSGWAFVVSYAGLAVGLGLTSWGSGAIGNATRLVGAGFLCLALGELGWLTFFTDGEAGGNVILPNLPYYASSVVFAVAAFRLYANGETVFGFPRLWLWGAVFAALILVSAMALAAPTTFNLGFWTDSIDSVLNGFASIVMICIAVLTAGGTWSRWVIPLAAGLGFRLLGNVYYTLTASTYAYGSMADWLWLLGSTAAYVLVMQAEGREQTPVAAS